MNPYSYMLIGFGFSLALAFALLIATDPVGHAVAYQFEKHQSR